MKSVCRGLPEKPYVLSKLAALIPTRYQPDTNQRALSQLIEARQSYASSRTGTPSSYC